MRTTERGVVHAVQVCHQREVVFLPGLQRIELNPALGAGAVDERPITVRRYPDVLQRPLPPLIVRQFEDERICRGDSLRLRCSCRSGRRGLRAGGFLRRLVLQKARWGKCRIPGFALSEPINSRVVGEPEAIENCLTLGFAPGEQALQQDQLCPIDFACGLATFLSRF